MGLSLKTICHSNITVFFWTRHGVLWQFIIKHKKEGAVSNATRDFSVYVKNQWTGNGINIPEDFVTRLLDRIVIVSAFLNRGLPSGVPKLDFSLQEVTTTDASLDRGKARLSLLAKASEKYPDNAPVPIQHKIIVTAGVDQSGQYDLDLKVDIPQFGQAGALTKARYDFLNTSIHNVGLGLSNGVFTKTTQDKIITGVSTQRPDDFLEDLEQ